jgi:hypothetical protein
MNRGWLAALTVAITLTLTLLAVEKHYSGSTGRVWDYAVTASEGLFQDFSNDSLSSDSISGDSISGDSTSGILLKSDAGLVVATPISPSPISSYPNETGRSADGQPGGASLLRRPPEPAASAVLFEPLTEDDFVSLPLTHASSSVGQLMESMDAALDGPIKMISLSPAPTFEEFSESDSDEASPGRRRTSSGPSSKMPPPVSLLNELNELNEAINNGYSTRLSRSQSDDAPHYVSVETEMANFALIRGWLDDTNSRLAKLVYHHGLESQESGQVLDELLELSREAREIGERLDDIGFSQKMLRTAYSIQRRAEVWDALRGCLDDRQTMVSQSPSPAIESAKILRALSDVEQHVRKSQDREAWRNYLLLDEISRWVNSGQDRHLGASLSQRFLSRVRWSRLDDSQTEFLNNRSVQDMAALLAWWNRDPVDYQHLMANIEQVEQTPESRAASTVTESIQVMRHSASSHQRRLAELLNTHYRNANLRLTLSQEFIQRFLPDTQIENRPVRQRILGAYTSGDSAVESQLSIRFHPDPDAWNVELGLVGEVVSSTKSSKGPAVFHNLGLAHVESQRYLRLDPYGYKVSSSPAQVASQTFLNRMSTDFDGLPIIGQFARMLVREQFNQKRGMAKRITQQKIATETDQELDRRLEESLKQAEEAFQDRILGPLQRLALNPLVVSMSTSADRLSVRYRLAHEQQITAFTPRPRAPADNLLSFQLHQSSLNNLLQQLDLSGRSWSIGELYRHLGSLFNQQWNPPEDVPEDITLRFADQNPVRIELTEGQIRLNLRFAEFQRADGLALKNFAITSSYVPIANGLKAGLIRDPDGVIEIQGRQLTIRERLALRVIFSKVFVSNPEISLVADQWKDDPRAAGLGISQMEVRDGWLGVAISPVDNPLVVEVAERSRESLNAVTR